MLPGFTDVVASTHAIGSWHTGALASHANQLAAMPSLHIAWAAWCVLAVWRLTDARGCAALALLYACLTGFAVLATGNHFLLDVFAGLARARAVACCSRRSAWKLRGAAARGAPRTPRDGVAPGARAACHKVVTKSETVRLAAPLQTADGRHNGSAALRGDFCVCRVALDMPDFDANEDLTRLPGTGRDEPPSRRSPRRRSSAARPAGPRSPRGEPAPLALRELIAQRRAAPARRAASAARSDSGRRRAAAGACGRVPRSPGIAEADVVLSATSTCAWCSRRPRSCCRGSADVRLPAGRMRLAADARRRGVDAGPRARAGDPSCEPGCRSAG